MLTTHSTGNIGYIYYLCLFMQPQCQLGSYIHACTNETHSLANLQAYFDSNNYRQHRLAKLGILCLKHLYATVISSLMCFYMYISCEVLHGIVNNNNKSCTYFFHFYMHGCNYPDGIVFA